MKRSDVPGDEEIKQEHGAPCSLLTTFYVSGKHVRVVVNVAGIGVEQREEARGAVAAALASLRQKAEG